MPRYQRTPSKTIIKAPRKKWNLGRSFVNSDATSYSVAVSQYQTIMANDNDTSVPTPTAIKAKRIKVYGCLTVQSQVPQQTTPQPVSWNSYIVYCPQIVYASMPSTLTELNTFLTQIIRDHPEWVMSRRNLAINWNGGQPSESVSYKWTQSTGKLSRILKSGDRIIFVLKSTPLTSSNVAHWQQLYAEFEFASTTC